MKSSPHVEGPFVLQKEYNMAKTPRQGFTRLAGSERSLPASARKLQPVNPQERIEISVYLRDPAETSLEGDVDTHAQQPGPQMSREAYIAAHSADPQDLA